MSPAPGRDPQGAGGRPHEEGQGEAEATLPGVACVWGLIEAPEWDEAVDGQDPPYPGGAETRHGRVHRRQRSEALSDPDAEHVEVEEGLVAGLAGAVVHEEVVDGGADPGTDGGDEVRPRQHRHRDVRPRQQRPPPHQDIHHGHTVSDDVDGLVVEVEETHEAAPGGEQRPVARLDVRVELKMLRDLLPAQERFLRPHV